MMTRAGAIFNFILSFLIAYALVFVWVRFYVDSIWLTAVIAFGITAAAAAVFWLATAKRRNRKAESFKDRARKNKIFNYMLYCTAEENLDFFVKIFGGKRENDILLLDDMVILCRFAHSKLMPDAVVEAHLRVKLLNPAKILLLCLDYMPQAEQAAANVPKGEMTLLNADDLYRKMKKNGVFPALPEEAKRQKRLPVLLSAAFNRKKVKSYIFSAAALVFASIFIQYSLYYRIFASILLVAALVSCFNPSFNRINVKENN